MGGLRLCQGHDCVLEALGLGQGHDCVLEALGLGRVRVMTVYWRL